MDWVLDSGNKPNGARVASIRIRPLRLAYLIPEDDTRVALRAIDSCCLTWGGITNPLIPYSKSDGLSQEWLTILQKFDPDHLVDCSGISVADTSRFQDRGQHVHRWEKPLETFFTDGTLQYSALNAFEKGLKDDRTRFVVQPTMDSDSAPLYLPLIARHGRLNEQFLEETLTLHRWSSGVRYADFAVIKQVNFTEKGEDALLGTTPPETIIGEGGGTFQIEDFVSLTRAGLHEIGAPYRIGNGSPEDPQEEEAFINTVIVTGKANSVPDLCLYWNLRIERPWAWPFPLWIPIDVLVTENGLEVVKRALSWMDKRMREGLGGKSQLCVLSTSVNGNYLQRTLEGKLEDARYETEKLNRFVSGKWRFHVAEEKKEVHFRDGHARVPVPRPEALKKLAPWDRVVHEVSFEGIKLPQSWSLQRHLLGLTHRLTQTGSEDFSYVSSWPDIMDIHIPAGWTILESIFADAGYRCDPSDKGRLALGVLRFLGDIRDLRIIASSKVYETLEEMSRVRGQKNADALRRYFAEREVFTYSRFSDKWGKNTEKILTWLVNKGLVFRGVELTCPRCQLAKWYELDRVKTTWHCDGCLNDSEIPLGLVSTNWSYRINELYARGHDQGIITHLLAMYAFYPPMMLGDTSIVGYHPGVVVRAVSEVAKQTRVLEMEIDFVSVRDGRLIIGECKASGASLTRDEVDRYVNLANHLRCSRVLFVTPASFPQGDELLIPAQQRCSAVIERLERQDILDISPRERRGVTEDKGASLEQKSAEYLDGLASYLQLESRDS